MNPEQTFMDDQALIERVLSHVRAGTSDQGEDVWREPVENYRSEERFRREINLLRRLPVPFCPAAALKEPGAYVARTAAGVPLLAVRGEDGTVGPFAMLAATEEPKWRAVRAVRVPLSVPITAGPTGSKEHSSASNTKAASQTSDKAAHGLVRVEAEDRAGIIFITQEGSAKGYTAGEGLPDLITSDDDLIDSHGQ